MDSRDIQMGQLIQAVATLTEEVNLLRTEVGELKGQVSRGKGFAMGLFLAAGGVGASISHFISSWGNK